VPLKISKKLEQFSSITFGNHSQPIVDIIFELGIENKLEKKLKQELTEVFKIDQS